jgi:sec-independent protein translocase protein TatB
MFDIGWSEMAVVALIALIVIGPKELPNAMRSLAKWTRKARSLAREFQSGIDEMVREADLDEARKAFDATTAFDVDKAVEDTIDPTGSLRDEAQELQDTVQSAASVEGGDEAHGAGEDTEGAPPERETTESGPTEASGEDEEEGAQVIETPVNIAPPHSLTPPPEEESAPSEEAPASGSNGSQQRA